MAHTIKTNTHAAHLIDIVIDAPKMGLNNVVIGRAQRVANTTNFGTQNVYEIGSIMPKESIPLRYEGSITLDNLIIRFDSIDTNKPVGVTGSPIESLGAEVLEKYTFDIIVRDKITKKVVRKYLDCTVVSANTEATANALLAESVTFYYLSTSADKGYIAEKFTPNDETTVYTRLGSGGTSGGAGGGNILSNIANNVVNSAVNSVAGALQSAIGGIAAQLTP